MASKGSFTTCMEQLHTGDSQAGTLLHDRFVRRLVALARTRLQPELSSKLDPDDVIQSVFKSFFDRHSAGRFDLEGWDSLWSLLVRITIRKCGRTAAKLTMDCRNVRRETDLQDSVTDEFSSREPTPEEAAVFVELIQSLFDQLSPIQYNIVALKLQFLSNEEISERVGRTERTVFRTLARLRTRLEPLEY